MKLSTRILFGRPDGWSSRYQGLLLIALALLISSAEWLMGVAP